MTWPQCLSRLALLVMYAGRLIEQGPTAEVLRRPRHPYTQGLIDSLPSRAPPGRDLIQIPGATPSLPRLPSGCAFRARCTYATSVCDVPPGDSWQIGSARALQSSDVGRWRREHTARWSAATYEAFGVASPHFTSVPPFTELGRYRRDPRPWCTRSERCRLAIAKGETLGLVGESGCGKSTLGRVSAGILRRAWVPRLRAAGDVGRPRSTRRASRWCFRTRLPRSIRACASATSLPRVRSRMDLIKARRPRPYAARVARGGRPRRSSRERFPHQFSGGQRQRVALRARCAMQARRARLR